MNLIWINCLGEHFYETSAFDVIKENPETGTFEETGLNLNEIKNNPFWSASGLKAEWETINGPLPDGKYLLPITPFILGGKFEASNLMAISENEAFSFYKNLRTQLKDLPDGTIVEWLIT